MNTKKMRLLVVGLIFFATSLVGYGQSRQEKSELIMQKTNLIENQKMIYKYQLESLKYQSEGNDSIRIIELEKQLSDDEIIRRINLAFNEIFTNDEINDLYEFIQTNVFEKFFNSKETYNVLASKFKDIDNAIEEITKNLDKTAVKPIEKFVPIPIERENGFYVTVDYNHFTTEENVTLQDEPSLTSKDILEIKKVFSNFNDSPEISIVFTKEGAKKFYLLTKENIGKPIAIVIAKKIVSMPIVYSEIIGGKASISGHFTEEEIDEMIEILQGK
jgi:hypothetical protein